MQDTILDYLVAEHILAYRMQSGAIRIDNRLVRFGVPGMADILAFPRKTEKGPLGRLNVRATQDADPRCKCLSQIRSSVKATAIWWLEALRMYPNISLHWSDPCATMPT